MGNSQEKDELIVTLRDMVEALKLLTIKVTTMEKRIERLEAIAQVTPAELGRGIG